MLKVAIIGCGKVAEKHANQIQRVSGTEIVGVCDQEELMAKQLSERIGVKHYFSDARTLLTSCKPDVVHITTPPQSHYALAKECLEAGCHIYVEKPFTVRSLEAEEVIKIAMKSKRKLTVGHETQFMPVAKDMRRLIHSGYLGGHPVHIESVYCYELTDERYAKAFLGDKSHWLRRLPGGLLQNIISHGIGKIVEYLQDGKVAVLAKGFTSSFLESIDERDIIDELRVIMVDSGRATAYFTFSSQMSPALHQLRVFGPKNSLIADHEHQTLIKIPGKPYKSFLNQFIPPLSDAMQHLNNGRRNVSRFLRNDFHPDSGIRYLVNSFYKSVTKGAPLPIPYENIVQTSRIMDDIFSQIRLSK